MKTFQIANETIEYIEVLKLSGDIQCALINKDPDYEARNCGNLNVPLNINKDNFSSNSKVYFLRQSKVSREKFRSFYENISVTRDPSKADFIIVPDNFFSYNINWSRSLICTKQSALSGAINSSIEQKLYGGNLKKLKLTLEKRNLENTYTPDYVEVGMIYSSQLKNFNNENVFNQVVTNKFTNLPFNVFEFYEKYSDKLITDGFIQQLLGESVIDLDAYCTLCTMLESNDKSNTQLACSIMEQCNYGSSIFYIIMLLKEYGATIKRNYEGVNNKKFRSMLDYCGFPYRRMESFTTNELVDLAFEHSYSIDETAYNVLNDYIKAYLQNRFDYVNIKHIEFPAEYEKLLKFKNEPTEFENLSVD